MKKKSSKIKAKNSTIRNRRNSKEYPALDKSVNLKSRQDLIDYDYLSKLSPEELKFLNKFTEETANASFKKKDGKYHGNIYKKKSEKLELFNENNARNRCQYTKAKAMGALKDGEVVINHLEDTSNNSTRDTENNLINIITAEIEDTIDFIKEGYELIETKGGSRWKKIVVINN